MGSTGRPPTKAPVEKVSRQLGCLQVPSGEMTSRGNLRRGQDTSGHCRAFCNEWVAYRTPGSFVSRVMLQHMHALATHVPHYSPV